MSEIDDKATDAPGSPERREFLAKAGRYAGATSAAVVVLLSTSKDVGATGIFRSGGGSHYHKRKKLKGKAEKRASFQRWKSRWKKG